MADGRRPRRPVTAEEYEAIDMMILDKKTTLTEIARIFNRSTDMMTRRRRLLTAQQLAPRSEDRRASPDQADTPFIRQPSEAERMGARAPVVRRQLD